MKLKNPNLSLFDYIIERELYDYISRDDIKRYVKDHRNFTVAKTTSFIFIYRNDGSCYFQNGDNLRTYILDNPSYFEGIRIFMADIDDELLLQKIRERNYYEYDYYFSDEEDALKWEGDYNGENIGDSFKLNQSNSDGYASLLGIYEVI
ncbi:hypothetical protein [Calidifontibacillus oryziterrae]|uniref:hypothetical protein n=1 Tax=Calidifontibacillus oryziterrae TaxID=1191699 RepID=UPI0002DF6EE8|nr:hypothetical protein [Calidifontibacillus oryziterrae]